jgi:hypothetical protein
MRSKDISLTEYPIENEAFFNKRDDHEFIFYEITLPQHMKQISLAENTTANNSNNPSSKSNKENITSETRP